MKLRIARKVIDKHEPGRRPRYRDSTLRRANARYDRCRTAKASDAFWNEHVHDLRRYMGYAPMTAAEAEAAYDAAPSMPLDEGEIGRMVERIVSRATAASQTEE